MPDPSRPAEATLTAEVLKVDAPKRKVWGWASVVERDGRAVVDKQGDLITPDELQAAVHDFVKNARKARVMHDGIDVGEVVDSIVLTRELQDSLGINVPVGWVLGMEMPAETIARVESGELSMFSIGGSAVREEAA